MKTTVGKVAETVNVIAAIGEDKAFSAAIRTRIALKSEELERITKTFWEKRNDAIQSKLPEGELSVDINTDAGKRLVEEIQEISDVEVEIDLEPFSQKDFEVEHTLTASALRTLMRNGFMK
jgi:hypothetical protein